MQSLELNNKWIRLKLKAVWRGMKSRCCARNPKIAPFYRERGIKVLWKDFEDFYSDMRPSFIVHILEYGKRETTIDRINPTGHYCKENCRWATYKVQYENTMHKSQPNKKMLTIDGVEKSVDEWSVISGISKRAILTRYRKGWTEKASVFSQVSGFSHVKQKPIRAWQFFTVRVIGLSSPTCSHIHRISGGTSMTFEVSFSYSFRAVRM